MPKTKKLTPYLNLPSGARIPSRKGKQYEVVNGIDIGWPGYNHLLGFGGSGEVYLVKDLELDRPVAIKIFIPIFQMKLFPDPSSSVVQNIEEEYLQEAQSLSVMKHRNIVTLFDTDTCSAEELKCKGPFKPDHIFHYIITEFVPGKSLEAFLCKYRPEKSAFLKILVQICNALIYLHESKEYLHCDVKSSNIVVDPERLDVKLIDFALTRNLNFSEVKPNDKVTLIGDWDIFPKLSSGHILKKLMDTREALVSRAEFRKAAFPRLDIYHFGMLLEKCLQIMDKELSLDDHHYLKQVAERCEDFEKSYWWYRSMPDVAYDIQKLMPDYESPHRIRALGESIRGEYIIQLPHPLHAVNFCEDVRTIIDCPQFQRLRSVLQLDLCHLIFPGATHTRFLHSLHCYQLMGEFLLKLASDRMMRMFLSERFVHLALIAALLHDIFHFPFLHVFDEIGEDTSTKPETLSTIDQLLISEQNGISLKNLLENIDINPEALWGIIKGWPTALRDKEKKLIHSFIDGGVDLDKISYLFYDSYYTGVPDGVGLDVNKLVRSSQIIKGDSYLLGWRASGLSPVEQVIMARYQMFKKVYWNSDNRSAIARVKYAIVQLLNKEKLTLEGYVRRTMSIGQSGSLILLNDMYKKEVNPHSPLEGLIKPRGVSMLQVVSGKRKKTPRGRLPNIPDDDALMSLGGFKLIEVSDCLANFLSKNRKVRVYPGEVIIDAPGRKVEELGDVWVDDETREATLVQNLSDPVKQLHANWQKYVKRVRLFVSRRITAEAGEDQVKRYLLEAMGWSE